MYKLITAIIILLFSKNVYSNHITEQAKADSIQVGEILVACGTYYFILAESSKKGLIQGSSAGDEIIFLKKSNDLTTTGMDLLLDLHIEYPKEFRYHVDKANDDITDFYLVKGGQKLQTKYGLLCENIHKKISE
tara:strand:+ start:814 stop:1215 length:402 start_codon:yes stop_codon:yes gene_type:complete